MTTVRVFVWFMIDSLISFSCKSRNYLSFTKTINGICDGLFGGVKVNALSLREEGKDINKKEMKYVLEPRPLKKLTKPICSARGDASKIMTEEGYKLFYIGYPADRYNKIVRKLLEVWDYVQLWLTLKKGDSVFMQWPSMMGRFSNNFIFRIATPPHVKELILLVHDIDTLRGMKDSANWNFRFFSKCTRLILHSEKMKEYVVKHGVDGGKVRALDCFDYLTKDPIKEERRKSKDVVFVGQLDKSAFLDKITEAKLGIHVNLYGRFEKDMGADVTYKCKFKPDNVSVLKGSWGLVWNGDSVDGCVGPMGDYLRYNSPHKVSLFIAAHLPIIIWDKAAKAEYVKEKGLGICVSSLKEISKRIDSVSDEEYKQMVKNVEKESELVRNGKELRKCIE